LQINYGSSKTRLQRRQGNVHDRAVNERHTGAENRRRENPKLGAATTGICSGSRFNYSLIARWLHHRRFNVISIQLNLSVERICKKCFIKMNSTRFSYFSTKE
jgi:hypothetical protein